MSTSKDQYIFIHSSRRVRIVKNDTGEIEEIYFNESKPIAIEGETRSLEQIAIQQKRSYYKEFFKKQFKNFLILSGAGSSIGIGKKQVGMSMAGLWNAAEVKLGEYFTKVCNYVNCSTAVPNLEVLLSLIEGHIKFSRENTKEVEKLIKNRSELLQLIKDKCDLVAPDEENDFPHATFIRKITQRKATLPRIKIFTLNYDLLFEQAANKVGAVILDGFSFTTPREFSGRYFDYDLVQREKSRLKEEDNFISRLFHLYKLHGSLNWTRDENQEGKIVMQHGCGDPLMVYPRESKYENSYEQPFFEMVARFQQNLRLDNTVLLCIGYSFGDKHINAIILEALNQNPGFQLAIINPDFDGLNKNFQQLLKEAKVSERVIMIDERFSEFANHFPEIQTYYQEPEAEPINM